jgi:hypothetical protein
MHGANEFASNDMKHFDWSKLPDGCYEWKNGELVRVDDDSKLAVDVAGDKVTAALRKFLNDCAV